MIKGLNQEIGPCFKRTNFNMIYPLEQLGPSGGESQNLKNPGGGCYKTQIPRPQIRPPHLLNQNYLQIGQVEEAWEYRSPVSSPGNLNASDGLATPAPTQGDPEQLR